MDRSARARRHGARRVAVLGAGSWGTTFAKILADGGNDVMLWARRPELAREIEEAGRNSDYLPGVNLPGNLHATSRLDRALEGAEQVYLSVPSQSLRENLVALRPHLGERTIVVSLMKGVEQASGLRMSEVIAEVLELGGERIAVVSGPNLALEIAKEQPTAAVVASDALETAEAVARASTAPYFRTFVNTDVVGTEFGGVLKNLIAVAIGIVDGVGYGENTKASIITRGLVEMTDFAVASGAHPDTLAGLAGLGDLIATCQSPLSRNNTAGRLLGQGYRLPEVVDRMQQTTEGLASVGPVLELARARGVEMPIVEQVRQVLAGTMHPSKIAPHLTTDSDGPKGERNTNEPAPGGSALRRALQRALDQLRHGGGVLAAIDRERFEVIPVGITRDGAFVLEADDPERFRLDPARLPEVVDNGTRVRWPESAGSRELTVQDASGLRSLGDVDVVFPILHGRFGEDGTIQGLFELIGLPYVGNGVLASAIGMDKHVTKTVLDAAGIAVAPWVTVSRRDWAADRELWERRAKALGLPAFVKPARAGSSVGVTKVSDWAELDRALELAFAEDDRALVESAVVGREIECGVLDGADGGPARVSVAGEVVVTGREFYDFEAKYLGAAGVELVCPAELGDGERFELERIAQRAFEAIGGEGLARVDVFLSGEGFVVNEVNTMPGFTPISMFPTCWLNSGLSYPELITDLVESGLARGSR